MNADTSGNREIVCHREIGNRGNTELLFLRCPDYRIIRWLDLSQYSTLTKKSPLAGAVAAAAERSRSSRMRRTSATGEAAFADHEKCTDEIANHVVKKSVAADGVDQFVAVTVPLGEKDGADIVGSDRDGEPTFCNPSFVIQVFANQILNRFARLSLRQSRLHWSFQFGIWFESHLLQVSCRLQEFLCVFLDRRRRSW